MFPQLYNHIHHLCDIQYLHGSFEGRATCAFPPRSMNDSANLLPILTKEWQMRFKEYKYERELEVQYEIQYYRNRRLIILIISFVGGSLLLWKYKLVKKARYALSKLRFC